MLSISQADIEARLLFDNRIARTFFIIVHEEIILLHGILKKSHTASLDRLLDPMNPSLTVASLGKAAAALGRKVELRFVPA